MEGVPSGGEVGLTDDEAKAKGPDFYAAEFKERLAKGPATFDLTAILGQDGDALDDPTVLWPEDRKSVKMGTLAITGLEEDATSAARHLRPDQCRRRRRGPQGRQDLPHAL